MRPSWPLPSTPMVAPGRIDAAHGRRSSRTLRGLLGAERAQLLAQVGPRGGENRDREQAGVGGAGLADRERAHRHAARHLHDRQQRVEAVERRALHRHAEHGQHGVRRGHARQMRRAARAGDDHFDAARLSAPCANSAIHTGVRCAETTCFSCAHAEALEHLDRVLHRVPVGRRAHDDGDERLSMIRIATTHETDGCPASSFVHFVADFPLLALAERVARCPSNVHSPSVLTKSKPAPVIRCCSRRSARASPAPPSRRQKRQFHRSE